MTLSDRIRAREPEWLRRVHAGELPRVVGGLPREPEPAPTPERREPVVRREIAVAA